MHVLVVAALLLGSVAFSSACPDFCTCENMKVVCRNAELTSIPEDLGEDTINLDLSNNNISVIIDKAFERMPLLEEIVIREDDLNIIQPGAFSGLENLKILDLHSNALESLHTSIFEDNINLIHLDLSYNSLKTFEPNLNSELIFLNLSSNQIDSESVSSLSNLVSLETLDISYNAFSSNLSDQVFSAMDNLKHLDISGNQLEHDCDLKTLWTLCKNKSINCVTDDEESWNMLENLSCGEDEEVTDKEATTPESEGFLSVENSVVESETDSDVGENGSGDVDPDATPDPNLVDSTGEATGEPAIEEEQNWIMIVTIVCVVIGVALLIGIVILCIIRRRKSRVETTGNMERANSIEYLNEGNDLKLSFKNTRNNSVKKTDNNKMRNNNYDRVMNPSTYVKNDPNRDVIPLSEYAAAEVVRVPSFKTHGIATPLNLPEEISPSSHSLPRSSTASSYDDNTLRAGSLRRYAKPELTVPDIQLVRPMRRVPSKK